MNELTQQGIAALKAGDRTSARQLLATAVKQDPNDALAWLWLTGTVDSDEDRLACLRQVLRIDPSNQAASRGMAQIYERRAKAESAGARPAPDSARSAPDSARPAPEGAKPAPEAQPPQPKPVPVPTPQPEPARTPTPAPPGTWSEAQPFESLRPTEEIPPEPDQETADAAISAAGAPISSGAETAPEAQPAPEAKPARKRAARPGAADAAGAARVIFRARPSLVPALICFWLFLFGALAVAVLLGSVPQGLLLAAGIGLILELVVVYSVIRLLTVRYELTSQQLTLRFRGKRAQIPVSNIYHAELSQNTFQRLLGIGDIDIDASFGGELAHLRMRNVPECKMRAEQIMYLVKEHEPA